jgi:hypothetical protein
MTPVFPVVADKMKKSLAYQTQWKRYKLAVSNGFYLEGIFILYAMMEDRLLSFLYIAGVVDYSPAQIIANEGVGPHLQVIFDTTDLQKIRWRNISDKIKLVRQMVIWSGTYIPDRTSPNFADVLSNKLNNTKGIDEIIPTLIQIQSWCKSRNELVHDLLNKNPEDQVDSLRALTEEGFRYLRKLSKFIRNFKYRNTIRKQFYIQ